MKSRFLGEWGLFSRRYVEKAANWSQLSTQVYLQCFSASASVGFFAGASATPLCPCLLPLAKHCCGTGSFSHERLLDTRLWGLQPLKHSASLHGQDDGCGSAQWLPSSAGRLESPEGDGMQGPERALPFQAWKTFFSVKTFNVKSWSEKRWLCLQHRYLNTWKGEGSASRGQEI